MSGLLAAIINLFIEFGTAFMVVLGLFALIISAWRWAKVHNPAWLAMSLLFAGGTVHRIGVIAGRKGIISWGVEFNLLEATAIILSSCGAMVAMEYLCEVLFGEARAKKIITVVFGVAAVVGVFVAGTLTWNG